MKLLMILFLTVIIFAILGTIQTSVFNIYEGHTGADDTHDETDMPPKCYSTVQGDYADYYTSTEPDSDCPSDKYILKSQIVPPVCPACPSIIGNVTNDPSDNKPDTVSSVTETTINNISNQETNTEIEDVKNTETVINNNEPKSSFSMFDDLKSEFSQLKQKMSNESNNGSNDGSNNGSCPPCPACERCPEPAFECKKVPNYRSQNIGSYLPMPVVNDFSTF